MSHPPITVLITDDDEHIRLMLRTALECEGYRVRQAVGAEAAIASIEHELPDVVVLDLWMPGINGIAVLEHLSQKPEEQRPGVIVLAAQAGIPDAVRAMRLGAADFLEKPITPDQLRKSVIAALAEHRNRLKQRSGTLAAPVIPHGRVH
jgi:DNA-binding NtrC family response regulator